MSAERPHASERDDPSRVGRYVIIERVGAGGMGVVYAAFDPSLERKIAIKLVRVRDGDHSGALRLIREAQSMAQLSHPNVVSVFDVGEHEGQVFIAMEFIRGRTADVWLSEQPRSWREIVALYRDAGAGLAAAHEAGLIHRDFKPESRPPSP